VSGCVDCDQEPASVLKQTPERFDIRMTSGDDLWIRIAVRKDTDNDPDTPPEIQVLDDYEFAAAVADLADVQVAEFQVQPDPDDPTHKVLLHLPAEATLPSAITFSGRRRVFLGNWDLQVTFPSGDVRTVAGGAFCCFRGVTP
jgi:hypothetical protein